MAPHSAYVSLSPCLPLPSCIDQQRKVEWEAPFSPLLLLQPAPSVLSDSRSRPPGRQRGFYPGLHLREWEAAALSRSDGDSAFIVTGTYSASRKLPASLRIFLFLIIVVLFLFGTRTRPGIRVILGRGEVISPLSVLLLLIHPSVPYFLVFIDCWILCSLKGRTRSRRICECESVPAVSSRSSGLEQGSMELVLVGCTGDVWEVLELRRRTGGPYLLLLCWLLAAHSTAHGEWGVGGMGGCAYLRACHCRLLRLPQTKRELTRLLRLLGWLLFKSRWAAPLGFFVLFFCVVMLEAAGFDPV